MEAEVPDAVELDTELGHLPALGAPESHGPERGDGEHVLFHRAHPKRRVRPAREHQILALERDRQDRLGFVATYRPAYDLTSLSAG